MGELSEFNEAMENVNRRCFPTLEEAAKNARDNMARIAGETTMSQEQATSIRKDDRLEKYKQIETLAYKWLIGEITEKRMAEAVFGIINEEVRCDEFESN